MMIPMISYNSMSFDSMIDSIILCLLWNSMSFVEMRSRPSCLPPYYGCQGTRDHRLVPIASFSDADQAITQ